MKLSISSVCCHTSLGSMRTTCGRRNITRRIWRSRSSSQCSTMPPITTTMTMMYSFSTTSASLVRRPSPVTPWIGAAARRAEIPGWHSPQVFCRFEACTVEVGSELGRMRWTPWYDAQLATWVSPALLLRPW